MQRAREDDLPLAEGLAEFASLSASHTTRRAGCPSAAAPAPDSTMRPFLLNAIPTRRRSTASTGVKRDPRTKRPHEPLSAIVSTSLIRQSAMRLSMISSGNRVPDHAERIERRHPGSGEIPVEHDPISASMRGKIIVAELDLGAVLDVHVVGEHPEVGFVDAEHLLHRLRRQPDLVTELPATVAEEVLDVRQLDRVRVGDRQLGVGIRQRSDRLRGARGLSESVGVCNESARERHSSSPVGDSWSSVMMARVECATASVVAKECATAASATTIADR